MLIQILRRLALSNTMPSNIYGAFGVFLCVDCVCNGRCAKPMFSSTIFPLAKELYLITPIGF